jgi:hypothetical protein
MDTNDIMVLTNMRESIATYRDNSMSLGFLADNLLALRDRLIFKDHQWLHELTQQIATLDSASTFSPKDEHQGLLLSRAVDAAINALLRQVEDKLTS